MINHWVFKCKDISYLISKSMDKKLSLKQRLGIKFHLMMCDLCRRYKKQLDLIQKAVSLITSSEKSSDDLITPLPDKTKEKIKKHLDSL